MSRSISRPPVSPYNDAALPSPFIPDIPNDDEPFSNFARFFVAYFTEHIDGPYSLHQLQLLAANSNLAIKLSLKFNAGIIAALLWCRTYFASHSNLETRYGLSNSRALACEVVAVECVGCLSEHDVIQYLTYEIPGPQSDTETESGRTGEDTGFLSGTFRIGGGTRRDETEEDLIASTYGGMNALEVAIIAESKYFLSQKCVQRVVDGIWDGRIMFWESLHVTEHKKPHLYNKRKTDPYSRLRVPKYQKAFEACFLAIFLALYYAVLIERNPDRITLSETLLLLAFVSFTVDEFSQWRDAGALVYAADIWSWLDLFVILMGIAFLICRIIGLVKDDDDIVDTSFDILSLEALLLVPRVFSLMSLHSYFGVLIPCLKQMSKDFIKFMMLVLVLYLGFLSTFCILGRESFTVREMSGLMIRVFFGSNSMGFDVMNKISPILGPPLMLTFVIMTNILLVTSLISLLSNSLTNMMNNAREEYLFQYSTFVMGSVTSNRLTYFYPPLNLIPVILLRPLRLFLTSAQARRVRIAVLKLTHFPLVAAIITYEWLVLKTNKTKGISWNPTSLKQPTTINRKQHADIVDRLKLAPVGVGVTRRRSQHTLGGGESTDKELRKLREQIEQISAKLDILLAK